MSFFEIIDNFSFYKILKINKKGEIRKKSSLRIYESYYKKLICLFYNDKNIDVNNIKYLNIIYFHKLKIFVI